MQCGLLRFLCSLVMYCVGTEADGTFLEPFQDAFPGLLRTKMDFYALDPAFVRFAFCCRELS